MEKINVLLAEDDFDFGNILKQYLEVHDFLITWAKDGKEALNIFKEVHSADDNYFNICVFDVMMPKIDGFNLAEKIIQIAPEIPFVFLTAKKMREDKIKGLKLGADDYIVKPFDADILVLRLKNILKRAGKASEIQSKDIRSYSIGNFIFDPLNHELKLNDKTEKLTEKEVLLIHYLFQHQNKMVKRETVLKEIWGSDDFFSGRSMDVFISRLRKYFKEDPCISIESTRGVGLTFRIEQ